MKSQQPQTTERTRNQRATLKPWSDMNRKQRRELQRKIQSEDLSLEVVHPDAAGIDIGNEVHYVAVPLIAVANPYVASDALRPS